MTIQLEVCKKDENSTLEVIIYGTILNVSEICKLELIEKIKKDYLNNNLEYLKEFKGRFVITINDNIQKRTLVITDFFGSIPLYFTSTGKFIYISNRLFTFKNKIDLAFNLYHTYQQKSNAVVFLKPTFLKDVYLISGNSILYIQHDDLSFRFLSIRQVFEEFDVTEKSLDGCIDEYENMLITSLKQRLTKDAVLTLSGGLDSSFLFAISPPKRIKHLFTLCTLSSIDNYEVDRTLELSQSNSIPHDLYPFDYKQKINIELWNESIIANLNPSINIENYFKYLLAKMISQQYGDQYQVITGIGSDHFNGGHTMTDYSNGKLNNNWSEFLLNLKSASLDVDIDYCELLSMLNVSSDNRKTWLSYLKYKHLGMMSGSLLSEFSTEGYFNLDYVCPFLDVDIVKFIASLPETLYEELFFNKSILRKVAKKHVPPSFDHTQKSKPNNKLVYMVNKFYMDLITENHSVIRERLLSSQLLNDALDTNSLIYILDKLALNRTPSDLYYYILVLYNYAVLGDCLSAEKSISSREVQFEYRNIYDLNELKKEVHYNDFHFDFNAPVEISDSVEVLSNSNTFYLVYNETITKKINNPSLKSIISNIDSHRSINSILKSLDLPITEFKDGILELYDSGYILNCIYKESAILV